LTSAKADWTTARRSKRAIKIVTIPGNTDFRAWGRMIKPAMTEQQKMVTAPTSPFFEVPSMSSHQGKDHHDPPVFRGGIKSKYKLDC